MSTINTQDNSESGNFAYSFSKGKGAFLIYWHIASFYGFIVSIICSLQRLYS